MSNDQLLASSPESLPQEAEKVTEKHTYANILKSTAFIGGSQAVNIIIRIVRTKAMALLLGPAGFGLFGIYQSIASLAQSIAEMGINSSGVRQIAEAVGSGDAGRIAMTSAVLRRTSLALGLLGAGLLLVFCRQVSSLTFGNAQHAGAIALLSVVVFLQLISDGQGALIQGMRRILDLAKMLVWGSLWATLVSIVLVYFFRDKGVVPALVGTAATTIVASWWYARKIRLPTPSVTFAQMRQEIAALLKLGFVFMATIFMAMSIGYAVRIILLRKIGLTATGVYQSAWTLGGLYVGFILQAMAADFYPHLTANAHDNTICNRLVNDQARVGLLLAGPGAIATLTFAPVVIALFYSAKFGSAVGVLRWICLGSILQVVTWPLGYVMIAKAKQAAYFMTQLAWSVTSVFLAYVCVRSWGLNGAGMAFFGSYVVFGLLAYWIVNRLSGFRWSAANKKAGLFFLFLITVVFCGFYVLPALWAACLGTLAALLSGVYSIRVLSSLVSWNQVPAPLRRLLGLFGPLVSLFARNSPEVRSQ
jgi:PST family polysaccharide transporter